MDSTAIGIRTAVMTVLSVSLGFGSHILQGGDAPSRGAAVISLLAVAALTMPLMRKSLGVGTTFSLLMAAQSVVHVLASLCADCGPAAAHLSEAGHGTHLAAGTGSGIGMVVGHAVIVALAAFWLSRGEALLAEAAGILLAGLVTIPALPAGIVMPSLATTRTAATFDGPRILHHLFLRSALVRRGPPVAA